MPGPGDLRDPLQQKGSGLEVKFTGQMTLRKGGKFLGKGGSGKPSVDEALKRLREGLRVVGVGGN